MKNNISSIFFALTLGTSMLVKGIEVGTTTEPVYILGKMFLENATHDTAFNIRIRDQKNKFLVDYVTSNNPNKIEKKDYYFQLKEFGTCSITVPQDIAWPINIRIWRGNDIPPQSGDDGKSIFALQLMEKEYNKTIFKIVWTRVTIRNVKEDGLALYFKRFGNKKFEFNQTALVQGTRPLPVFLYLK